MSKQGVIYLVGTGPGDVGLITVKGLALLGEADAIVADTLGHARLLQQANPEASRHDIGSRRRGNKQSATDTTQLLIELAQQGKSVVRLWEGDPFVFGRAAEEMAAALQARLRVEVVPGVTSATAAPAFAGVPVTHWDYASSFAVVSGYIPANSPQPNWAALAHIDTLIILMPDESLAEIVARLIKGGRAADTPALLVQHGSQPYQKQTRATLETLPEVALALDPPLIVVVGPSVELADTLAWFKAGQAYPLLGQRVLVTRSGHQAADFMAELRAMGAEPISFPTIEIRPVADSQPLDSAIQRLGAWARAQRWPVKAASLEQPYHWLVLTSANGVRAFWARLSALNLDSRSLAAVRIAAIGPATAASLQQRSLRPDLIPAVYTAEGVLAAFDQLEPVAGQRFLLARADIARKTLADGLIERGAIVDEIPAYRTVPVTTGLIPPAADIVTFTSSSTVQGYVNCLQGRPPVEILQDSRVVCIGPVTAATAEALDVPVAGVAEEYTIQGLLDILRKLAENRDDTSQNPLSSKGRFHNDLRNR